MCLVSQVETNFAWRHLGVTFVCDIFTFTLTATDSSVEGSTDSGQEKFAVGMG